MAPERASRIGQASAHFSERCRIEPLVSSGVRHHDRGLRPALEAVCLDERAESLYNFERLLIASFVVNPGHVPQRDHARQRMLELF
jgi:hypothetical protein